MHHRPEKINELIKQEIGKIILKEGDLGPDVMVTILGAQAAEDQKTADVFFSVWPSDKAKETAEKIKHQTGWLQNLFYKKISLHPTPKIKFILNTDETEGQKIDTLIKKLNTE